jgi:hypothetical protein
MQVPLATIFHGDVTLEQGSDVTQFGYGDINVNRKVIINGSEDSNGLASVGSLLLAGGGKINKSLHVGLDLTVLGVTRLQETHVSTNDGPFTVTGGNSISMSVGASSHFKTTEGTLTVSADNNILYLYGGANTSSAVDVKATDVNGGVRVLSGASGSLSLISGNGGLHGITSNGNLTLTANNGFGNFIVNSSNDNQNLVLSLAGNTDSQIKIESNGNNTTRDAIVVNTSHTNGNITMSNWGGLGNGGIDILAGAGGFSLTTNTTGPISITSQAAPASFIIAASTSGQHMSVGVTGPAYDSTFYLLGSGQNTAIKMESTHSSGNIFIGNSTSGSAAGVYILAGGGGLNSTSSYGSTVITSYGASSTYTNNTTADHQDLTISVTGNTNSKVVIDSSGTSQQAILFQTGNSGGVFVNASGPVNIQSSDNGYGINIGSLNTVPITIGTNMSTTTIKGNLVVNGTTTTVESNVVTIDDNIITVNNAPLGTSDGGLAIKRYQEANDNNNGDVVQDVPEFTGTVQAATTTTITFSTDASNVENFYNGYWIKITGGEGMNQVRRIKSYSGSTRVATIYDDSDQVRDEFNNPIRPIEGMNFTTTPLAFNSTYALYPCQFVMSIWDESADEFALVCSSSSANETANIAHYADLHLNNLTSNGIYTNYINDLVADTATTLQLNDGTSDPVSISGLGNNYGIYLVFVKPLSNGYRSHGIFMLGRVNESSTPGTVVRIISVKGTQYDQLDMQWPANSPPQLLYRKPPLGGTMGAYTSFRIKLVTL